MSLAIDPHMLNTSFAWVDSAQAVCALHLHAFITPQTPRSPLLWRNNHRYSVLDASSIRFLTRPPLSLSLRSTTMMDVAQKAAEHVEDMAGLERDGSFSESPSMNQLTEYLAYVSLDMTNPSPGSSSMKQATEQEQEAAIPENEQMSSSENHITHHEVRVIRARSKTEVLKISDWELEAQRRSLCRRLGRGLYWLDYTIVEAMSGFGVAF